MTVELYTSRWANKDLGGLDVVPVQTSRGTPRWKLGYTYRRAMWLAPDRETWALRGDEQGFRASYLSQLEALGAGAILGRLEGISGGLPVVLLCFEDVLAGEVCHRRYVADFLEERAGIVVPELRPGDLPRREGVGEPTLF